MYVTYIWKCDEDQIERSFAITNDLVPKNVENVRKIRFFTISNLILEFSRVFRYDCYEIRAEHLQIVSFSHAGDKNVDWGEQNQTLNQCVARLYFSVIMIFKSWFCDYKSLEISGNCAKKSIKMQAFV